MRRAVAFVIAALVVLVIAGWLILPTDNGRWWVFKLVLIGVIGATVYTLLVDGPSGFRQVLHPRRHPRPHG